MIESKRHDRYPGPRSFTDTFADQRLFFGRDREINDLFHQVLSTNLLVLFGKSGLGKTSLLQAGLFPCLRERNLLPLPLRFNRTDLSPLELFITAVAETCQMAGIDYTPGETGSLWEFFKTAVFWREDILQTPVLVLDQFEEIFTLQSAANRQWVARELGELVGRGLPQHIRARLQAGERISYSEQPPVVKVIISLREDYLGTLQELADEVPQILENRFRLTAMSSEQARPAVVEPALLPQGELFATRTFSYEDDAVGKMLAFLKGKTEEIEPFQLQLLCRQVELRVAEEQAKGRESIRVDRDYLGGKAKMQAILQNFYLDTIKRLPSWRVQNRVRELCEEGLLDAKGHCRILEEEDIKRHYRVGEVTLRALVDARLLRKEVRSESFYYELSHGNLAQPVQDSRRWRMPRRWKIILGACLGVVFLAFVVFQELARIKSERIESERIELEKIRAIEAREKAEDVMRYLVYGYLREHDRLDFMEVYKRIGDYYEKMGSEDQQSGKLILYSTVYIIRGELLTRQNDLQEALQAYQRGLELAKKVYRSDPNNIDAQNRLAVIHEKMGDIWVERGSFNTALADYEAGLEMNKQLTQRDPNKDEWQLNLSISYNKVGDVLKERNDLDGALRAYQDGLKIRKQLAQSDPDNTEWQRDLLLSYTMIEDIYSRKGNSEEARATHDQALSIIQRLRTEDQRQPAL